MTSGVRPKVIIFGRKTKIYQLMIIGLFWSVVVVPLPHAHHVWELWKLQPFISQIDFWYILNIAYKHVPSLAQSKPNSVHWIFYRFLQSSHVMKTSPIDFWDLLKTRPLWTSANLRTSRLTPRAIELPHSPCLPSPCISKDPCIPKRRRRQRRAT